MVSKHAAKFEEHMYRPVIISDKERQIGDTLFDNIQVGVEELQENGILILQNAVSHETIDKLCEKMTSDIEIKLKDPDLVFNHGQQRTNFSLSPPISEDFLFEEIWANKHAIAILENILGPRPQLSFASSNINLPQKGYVHRKHLSNCMSAF